MDHISHDWSRTHPIFRVRRVSAAKYALQYLRKTPNYSTCYVLRVRLTYYALRITFHGYRSSRMALASVMAAMWAAGVGKPAPMVLMPRWVAPRSRQARAF